MNENAATDPYGRTSTNDPLTVLLVRGLEQLIATVLEIEAKSFLAAHENLLDPRGRLRIVRNGFVRERTLRIGSIPVRVRMPRMRDRAAADVNEPIHFRSALIDRYRRRPGDHDEQLPWKFWEAAATGEFRAILRALSDRPRSREIERVLATLRLRWQRSRALVETRDLSKLRGVLCWAEGLDNPHERDEEPGILLVAGATAKEGLGLLAIARGTPDSEVDWVAVMSDLKRRGLTSRPTFPYGQGPAAAWRAVLAVYPIEEPPRDERLIDVA